MTNATEPDSGQTGFWTKRWDAGKIPWDLGDIPVTLHTFLLAEQKPGRVLVPGCGSGYEVKAFRQAGYDVTAIDLAGAAVERARGLFPDLADRFIHANFFKHDFGSQLFDLVYERGFLCSLPMTRWPEYAARMSSLIIPGGRLAGLFLYGEEPEPPPFPLTKEYAEKLLGGTFKLLRSQVSTAPTVPVYQGMEHWQEWQRIGI